MVINHLLNGMILQVGAIPLGPTIISWRLTTDHTRKSQPNPLEQLLLVEQT